MLQEIKFFASHPWSMKALLLTNFMYGLVTPIIELFIGAYIMRNSTDLSLVVIFQLAVYTGIPLTFMINGLLLKHIPIARLYSLGMLLSGVSMTVMMSLDKLSTLGIFLSGLIMGLSFGFFWANRDFLALNTTQDGNRNYYYGVETFFYTITGIGVPLFAGIFIASTEKNGWFGGNVNVAYYILTGYVFILSAVASVLVHRGNFKNPPSTQFIYFKFHAIWNKMLQLAALKGVAQGYIVTAPTMLVLTLVGKEGSLGLIQGIAAFFSAILLYALGRLTKPNHRILIYAIGCSLFVVGALLNAALFSALGAILFILFLLFARPLLDIAYFPIQLKVIDVVSKIENRNEFTYIFNHELGLYIGRLFGCGLFIVLARTAGDYIALRYALLVIAVVHFLGVFMAKRIDQIATKDIKAVSILIFCAFCGASNQLGAQTQSFPALQPVAQKNIGRVEKMPNHPKPYAYKDWKKTALDFDTYIFDFNQKGDFLPLVWLDSTQRNFPQTTFGIYTAFGDIRMGAKINNGENHEALGGLGAVLGATLVGIDKSHQDGKNYVRMLRNYFNKDNGWNVIMNFTNEGAHIGGGYGNDFWYEVHNNVLFYSVANYYPNEHSLDSIVRIIAEQFYTSDSVMGNNYSYSFFDFKNMQPGKNQIPTQEDVAAGYAFILYSAYIKFGDAKYLRAAKNAMDVLYNQKENRFYEEMMPLAAYVGARMNVEVGTHYDIQRFLDWTFDGTAVGRTGWGVLNDTWGGYDVSGLLGSTLDHGGYGFLMNTFDLMMPLSAMLRYDKR